MASGQVVAASNAASHPEIGGDAAAYFDPRSAEEMASVIARLLRDKTEYEERRRLGLQQAAQFSWERAARETLAVYDTIR
jgi:glycosyltransferase involved in cell wall biosynthesis